MAFSAEIYTLDPDGLFAKVYVDGSHIRLDMAPEGPAPIVFIGDLAGHHWWTLLPGQKLAVDQGSETSWEHEPSIQLADVHFPYSADNPCLQIAGAKCAKGRSLVVDGRTCDEWKVMYADGTSSPDSLCLDSEILVPLRTVSRGKTMELRHVTKAPQAANFFEKPAALRATPEVSMPAGSNSATASAFDLSRIKDRATASFGSRLATAGLGDREQADVVAAIAKEAGVTSVEAQSHLNDQLLATHLDMGDGPLNGLAVHGNSNVLCKPDGDCKFWLLHRVRFTWRLVRGDWAGDESILASAVAFIPPPHTGFFELVTIGHQEGDQVSLGLWWYDGNQFHHKSDFCSHPSSRAVDAGKCQ